MLPKIWNSEYVDAIYEHQHQAATVHSVPTHWPVQDHSTIVDVVCLLIIINH